MANKTINNKHFLHALLRIGGYIYSQTEEVCLIED